MENPAGAKPPVMKGPSFKAELQEIRRLYKFQEHLRHRFERFEAVYKQDYEQIAASLHEDQYRRKLLEGQLCELTEMCKSEVSNLREELGDAEEKVTYEFNQTIDVCLEELNALHPKLGKLEKQQDILEESNSAPQKLYETIIYVLVGVITVLIALVFT